MSFSATQLCQVAVIATTHFTSRDNRTHGDDARSRHECEKKRRDEVVLPGVGLVFKRMEGLRNFGRFIQNLYMIYMYS